jgi:hypothetical protein
LGRDDDDTISAHGAIHSGRIFAGNGNDEVTTSDVEFEVWGGSGDDELNGASECGIYTMHRVNQETTELSHQTIFKWWHWK